MTMRFWEKDPDGKKAPCPQHFAAAEEEARAHWDGIAKPLHSLGVFEDLIVQMAGIRGTADVSLSRRRVLVFCADNGIVREKVTQCGSDVTAKVARNIGAGKGNICTMAETASCDVLPVDVGMAEKGPFAGVLDRKTACGTKDFALAGAMTEGEALHALQTGFSLAESSRKEGYDILLAGEMGIGNTTTSSAIVSALLKMPARAVTGRGAGLDEEGFQRKISLIDTAAEKYGLYEADPLKVLCAVGGFDIAATAGLFMGAARFRIPVILDGCISAASALLAERLLPGTVGFLIPSHLSAEPSAKAVFKALGLRAVIDADLALGEGTGAVMMLHLLDAALSVYRSSSSFAGIGMEAYRAFDENGGQNLC